MSDNPYSEPVINPYGPTLNVGTAVESGPISLPPEMKRGLVNHVPIIGVLMIVQGVFDALMAIGTTIYAVFMPTLFEEIQRQGAQGNPGQPMPAGAAVAMTAVVGVMALVMFVVGILAVYSGIQLLKYRSRVLAISSLCGGMATIITCYCFPSSILLAIYGLVVLLNPSVKLAFDLRSRGHEADTIQRAFLSLNP